MKKLILSAMLTAFAAVAVYAGESCTDGSSCCSKMKTSMQTTSASCSSCSKSKTSVTKSSKHKTSTAKKVLQSPKAMSLACR